MRAKIVVLPGDGIGPEVTVEAVRALQAVAKHFGHRFDFEFHLIGGASIDANGSPLPDETLSACRKSSAVLLGAVGGPRWGDRKREARPEAGLLRLRREMDTFANLRPIRAMAGIGSSPLRDEVRNGTDFVIVRELSSGIYYGEPRGRGVMHGGVRAIDTLVYFETEIERVVRFAFRLSQGRKRHVTLVDKANVLETSRLWREVATRVAAQHPDVAFEPVLVDAFAARVLQRPTAYDVIVTENLFGDILSDEAAVIAGSIGLLPSACLAAAGPGIFEPVHGSAPDIAGKGVANPFGAIGSAALLLRHGLGLAAEAAALEAAMDHASSGPPLTRDLGGTLTTASAAGRVLEALAAMTVTAAPEMMHGR